MIEENILSLIGNYGFPIVITLWFMLRTEKIINRNTEAIEKMSDMVSKLCNKRFK
jgi:hypothetical protein